ncbi:unnamed protein product [Mucor fragilis]
MLLSKVALSVLAIAGVCSASDRFMIRSPRSSRLLGFTYEKKPIWGGSCQETYDKYLKVQSSGKGVHFKLTGCDDDDYCHLAITDGDYKGYCLSGDKRPESQSCNDENNIYKVNLDFTISAKDGTYLGVGNEYKDDCADFQYVELTKEKYHWLIDHDKDFNGQDYEDEEYDDYYDYPYHPRGGQRIFHHCRG